MTNKSIKKQFQVHFILKNKFQLTTNIVTGHDRPKYNVKSHSKTSLKIKQRKRRT